MHWHQAHDSMSMSGQHDFFTRLRSTDKISQTRLGVGYSELQDVLIFTLATWTNKWSNSSSMRHIPTQNEYLSGVDIQLLLQFSQNCSN